MYLTSTLSSTDITDYQWPEAELTRFHAYMTSDAPTWQPPTPKGGDPGPDRTHQIAIHIPEYVSRDRVQAFEHTLQEQGAYGSRLAALDQVAYRVRAAGTVTARAYRVFDAILDASRGRHRCCLLDLDKIAYLAGAADRSVASKVISELEDSGHVATLKFTEGPLGAPTARRLIVAPIVTVEDRAQTTSGRIYAEADVAKAAILRKRAEEARSRRRDASSDGAEADEPGPRSCQDDNYGVVDAASTTRSRPGVNGVVDESPIRSGRGGNSVYQKSNIKEGNQREPAEAGSPPPHRSPASPNGVSSAASSSPPSRSGAASPHPRPAAPPVARPPAPGDATVQTALDFYNEAARQHGYAVCQAFSPSRANRLEKRLDEIGGIEPFKRAVSAIALDDFLAGRVQKDGRAPFRLDIDALLQTDGKLGDVLAKLLDRASAQAHHSDEDIWVAEQMRTAKGRDRIQSMGREDAEKMLRDAYRAQVKQEANHAD